MAQSKKSSRVFPLSDKQDKIMGTKELSSFICYDSTIFPRPPATISDTNHLNAFQEAKILI